MGWWHWIVDALVGRSADAIGKPKVAASRDRSKPTAGAVATLEAPPDTKSPQSAHQEEAESQQQDVDAPWWAKPDATATDLIAPDRPELDREATAFENLLISHFDGHDLSLPSIPHILERVLHALRDRDCDYNKLAHAIGEDQVIAAAVLRMVNSPLYRANDKITTLKPAITRLGSRAMRTLMMHEALKATVFAKGSVAELAQVLWYRALASSCIMRGLAEFAGVDTEDAALIGLLHDIGSVIVLRLAQREMDAGRYAIKFDTFEFFCHETHQEFGELVADGWKLPDKLKSLIANHHEPPTDDDPYRTERWLLQLTEMINSMLGYGYEGAYDLMNVRPVVELGLHEKPGFREFLDRLPVQLDEMVTTI